MNRKRLKSSWNGPRGRNSQVSLQTLRTGSLFSKDPGSEWLQGEGPEAAGQCLGNPLRPGQVVPGGSVPHLQGAPRREEDPPTPLGSHLPFPPSGSADSIKPGVRSIQRDLDHPSLGPVPDLSSPSGVLLLVHPSSRSVSRVGP